MPTSPTYPGVYIQELPSGNRTIVGVGTSITAFVGRARRGPTDEPVRVASFGEFARIFGGLWSRSPMSYAVYQYFLSGGTTALIVRVTDNTATEAGSSSGTSVAAGTDLALEDVFFLRAKNVSEDNGHGDDYRVSISHPDAADNGVHRFVLQLADNPAGTDPESHNVTMIEGDDAAWTYIGDLATRLQEESNIAELLAIPTRRPPLCTLDAFTGGSALPETAATWSVEHVSGLVLQAPGVGADYKAVIEHDPADVNRFTLKVYNNTSLVGTTLLTVDPADSGATYAGPGVALDDDTTSSISLGSVVSASRDRPEPTSTSGTAYSGSASTTGTVSLPGIRGVRFQATAGGPGFGDTLRLAVTPAGLDDYRTFWIERQGRLADEVLAMKEGLTAK